jgi:plasmid maintenance system antidote protein VapI
MAAKQPIPAKFDWYVPPGEMLEDYLEDREKKPEALAQYLGVSESYVQDLLSCKEMMTVEMARKIADFLDMPKYYWEDTVTGYEEFLAKKQDRQTVVEKLNNLPYRELINIGLEKEAEKIRKIAEKILKSAQPELP